jgi:exonuclease III
LPASVKNGFLITDRMKIITWNCQMAFRKKAEFILNLKPDILIVPECEHPDKLKFTGDAPIPTDIYWIGENKNKGLGVFSYSDYKFELLDKQNTALKNILPLKVSNDNSSFKLLAIWANNPKDNDGAYITQVWKAIHHYDHLLTDKQTIIIGDFNSNTIWDKPRREGNHSTVVDKLEKKNILSTYHYFYKQEQGKEEKSTLYMFRHEDKKYHIDYCFASIDYINKLKNVEIGNYKDWCHLSDHAPLSITFDQ